MPSTSTHHCRLHRRGFSLIELLVVISIIAILAGLLIPAINIAIRNAQMARNGNNGKQVVTMLRVYAEEHGRWPMLAAHQDPAFDRSTPDAARQVTIGSFATLQLAYPDDIGSAIFQTPGSEKPLGWPKVDNTEAWGWSGSSKIGYAFDWSAPTLAGANRIVLGDRNLETIRRDKALVVFGDGHYEYIDTGREAPTEPQADGSSGSGGDTGAGDPDAGGATITTQTTTGGANNWGAWHTGGGYYDDNIWDTAGDAIDGVAAEDLFSPGLGHGRRVHLK